MSRNLSEPAWWGRWDWRFLIGVFSTTASFLKLACPPAILPKNTVQEVIAKIEAGLFETVTSLAVHEDDSGKSSVIVRAGVGLRNPGITLRTSLSKPDSVAFTSVSP